MASTLLSSSAAAVDVESAKALCGRYSHKPREALPRTVCLARAFVKTEWEGGKLHCEDDGGHVHCAPAFVAAPIFDSKTTSDNGLPDNVWAWAVTHGRHVDADYRPDGTLCGYLAGHSDFEFYLGEYRLAVERVIDKHHLALGSGVEEDAHTVPLHVRPMIFTVDPAEASDVEQLWFLAAVFLLCLCPCAGPVPVGAVLVFLWWMRHDRYRGWHTVANEDDADAVPGALYL